jgi:hypothetical protein
MRCKALIWLLLAVCNAYSQRETPIFPMPRKSLPLTILNSGNTYFHLLRYNREAHDITVEKRSRTNGAMLAFTPLKLDSVNANWFDYEDLDRWFFSFGDRVCFVFEKVTNSERTLYCKVIDSTGRSSGFIRIASIGNNGISDFSRIRVNRCGESGLLVMKVRTNGESMHTEADLFDLRKRRTVATYRLQGVLLTERNATLTKDSMLAYPIVMRSAETDSVWIAFTDRKGSTGYIRSPVPAGFRNRNATLTVSGEELALDGIGFIAKGDSAYGILYQVRVNITSKRVVGTDWTPYSEHVNKQLDFYDGPHRLPHLKHYSWVGVWTSGRYKNYLFERRDDRFAKELLYVQRDSSGAVAAQAVIPRKLLIFRNRIPYHYVDEPMISACNGRFSVALLESRSNHKVDTSFRYHKFAKETGLWNANIVSYGVENGRAVRSIIYRNAGFDLVPVQYDACGRCGAIYYITNSRDEKFLFTD